MGLPARLRTPAKLVASVLIALVSLELITRGWMAARGRAYSGWRTTQAIEEMATSIGAVEVKQGRAASKYLLHPFTGWEEHVTRKRIAAELPHFLSGEDDATFDILLVGSSVAAAFGNGGSEVFLEVVAASPSLAGREMRFLGHGRSAYKQPQQLFLLQWLLLQGYEPDAVICIDGFNEMALSLANSRRKIPPVYPGWGQWGPLVSTLPVTGEGRVLVHALEEARLEAAAVHATVRKYRLANSAVFGSYYRTRMVRAQERWQAAAEELSSALASFSFQRLGAFSEPEEDQAILDSTAEVWQRATTAMADLCRARQIPFLHVLQPNPNIPGSKPLTAQEQELVRAGEEWMLAATEGYPRIRAAREELRTQGLDSLDATMIFSEVAETVWRDAGHLNRVGNSLLGRKVGEAFTALLEE
ncbi:MAG: hypothetical protein O2816_12805 [Planctomycetota bacterium]|nr:hypothetical protein [Planctomycetota bacterium]